eukprot:5627589-Pyramimonas_sp.AAC.1
MQHVGSLLTHCARVAGRRPRRPSTASGAARPTAVRRPTSSPFSFTRRRALSMRPTGHCGYVGCCQRGACRCRHHHRTSAGGRRGILEDEQLEGFGPGIESRPILLFGAGILPGHLQSVPRGELFMFLCTLRWASDHIIYVTENKAVFD